MSLCLQVLVPECILMQLLTNIKFINILKDIRKSGYQMYEGKFPHKRYKLTLQFLKEHILNHQQF